MRNLEKTPMPQVLEDNADRWAEDYLNNPGNDTCKYRYREPSIKAALKAETGNKCIYCESKIGHNTPGDTEHMIPSSAAPDKHFQWENLTIACGECNRRKNAYNDPALPFLNPYSDDVESMVVHYGPVVSWKIGQPRAEATLRKLEIHNNKRSDLIARKVERIESINNILERINGTTGALKELLEMQLVEMQDKKAEYSGMTKSIVEGAG